MIEKAIHITKPENLKYYNQRYSRIYFGNEFCQNLIPSLKQIKEAIIFARRNKAGFTLLTPFVTELGLSKLSLVFQFLKKNESAAEIIVNDWGVLELLATKYRNIFELSLGRLLTRQQRDPSLQRVIMKQQTAGIKDRNGRIKILVHVPPGEKYHSGIQSSYINSISLQRFLYALGIRRVELNNIIQGLLVDNIIFEKTIYTPFINISTTRFCPMLTPKQKKYRISFCRRECQKVYSKLRNRYVPKIIYKQGNTTFYKNPVALKKITLLGIGRVVYQPQLPF